MTNQSASALKKKRERLLTKLPELQNTLRGSLIERYKRCGKPGCRCAAEQGHGPKYYLSTSQPGSNPLMEYVPLEYKDQVEDYLKNYRLARKILDEICDINQELLRRREEI
jgi:hypothetical protein